jgi:hypothetical protein
MRSTEPARPAPARSLHAHAAGLHAGRLQPMSKNDGPSACCVGHADLAARATNRPTRWRSLGRAGLLRRGQTQLLGGRGVTITAQSGTRRNSATLTAFSTSRSIMRDDGPPNDGANDVERQMRVEIDVLHSHARCHSTCRAQGKRWRA